MSSFFTTIDYYLYIKIIMVFFKIGVGKLFEYISESDCPCGKNHIFTSKVIIEKGAILLQIIMLLN